MRKSNKVKTPIVFRVGVILLCGMMLSCYLVGGLYAKYSTAATVNASARVARFDCKIVDGYIDERYAVQITNNSEVTIKYSVECSKLPEGVLLKICDIDGNFIPEQDRNLKPNDTIAFLVEITENYATAHERIDASLIVRVEQVD